MKEATDNAKLLDGVLLGNGVQFAAAADAYAAINRSHDWFVLYFLFAQSLELTLKAYLIRKGVTEKKLKNIGHSLTKAMDEATRASMDFNSLLTTTEIAAIHSLGRLHESQVTRYPLLQGYAIPKPQIVRQLLGRLIAAVYVEIWGAQQYEHDKSSERGGGLSFDLGPYAE